MHRQVNVLFVTTIAAVFMVMWLDNNAGVVGQTTDNSLNCTAMCPNDPDEILLHIEGDCYHYCECRNGTGIIRHCPQYVDPLIWICKDPATVSPNRSAYCYSTSSP